MEKQVEKMISSVFFQISKITIIKLQQMMVHLPTPQVSPHKMFKEVRNNGNPKRGGIPKIFLNS
jgi:hypothetical protein